MPLPEEDVAFLSRLFGPDLSGDSEMLAATAERHAVVIVGDDEAAFRAAAANLVALALMRGLCGGNPIGWSVVGDGAPELPRIRASVRCVS